MSLASLEVIALKQTTTTKKLKWKLANAIK